MRKSIPKIVKTYVYNRQNGKCVCCMETGREFHHIYPAARGEYQATTNIVLLCQSHHSLFHLGDPETFQAVYEYGWFLLHNKLPEYKDLENISIEFIERIRQSIKEK